ncbi:hypothetical protein O181_058481 [Austropuccinia psidii MF-1]|uniref:Uncharacterized protein n=1 Tax=Austropuccinia psidii MF-1 TaxID=1389203 RepID=A0A9Q3EH54_9BASI|nr:hypothetical protein [Austropuccinia psidii MF-1]
MPPRRTTDDLGVGQPEQDAEDIPRLFGQLTEKVQAPQLDLDTQKQLNQQLLNAPENQNLNQIEPVQRRFWKGPLALHFFLNPEYVMLGFDGKNYITWLECFSTTINFVYKIPPSAIDNFLPTLTNNDEASVLIVLLQTIDDSTKNRLSKPSITPSCLFLDIKRRCDSSERLDKLDLVRQLLCLIKNDKQRATSTWLLQYQEIYSKLIKWKLSIDEFYWLIVQAGLKIPDDPILLDFIKLT